VAVEEIHAEMVSSVWKVLVEPGAQVAAGDTLVIVEAMKVMNPITAPKAGVVRQVLVQDAQPVEYDQPLVVIE
jgi:acetyl-CoA carboxylase biotin carboxyl carrier protein